MSRKANDQLLEELETEKPDPGQVSDQEAEQIGIENTNDHDEPKFKTFADVVKDTQTTVTTELKPDTMAVALANALGMVHHELAIFTGYDGWEIDHDTEFPYAVAFAEQVVPHIPVKYFGLIIATAMLLMLESGKVYGYIQYAGEQKKLKKGE